DQPSGTARKPAARFRVGRPWGLALRGGSGARSSRVPRIPAKGERPETVGKRMRPASGARSA
ncbi:unnamed protein product, partial [Amoebophrya sp. A25]